ncbi:Ribosomal RNA small subunit methyltransferase F [Paenibacillus plantiphilus]|uniref:Ribosomal RNA small subunit methyltransferase F n=2 Tax=Paenibacillus plantiphilus TaxID=2905650 RepID=A0ABM9CIA7_9BACL|nr:Ribosomal RNA small subunit methyltransferase F [Paenibacillus plantiphilus]
MVSILLLSEGSAEGVSNVSITLPQSFLDKMQGLLDHEYEAFMASYEQPRKYGLRVNGLKLSEGEFLKLSPWGDRLVPIPWASGGYYYVDSDRPGKHPHYHAGLYYIQEPSAMVPAELLDVRPGDRVLDLCAAPGGKSTQLAAKLQGKGVLVTNDNARERTKALAKNIELAGIRNAVVLNEEPAALAKVFEGWFDRVLVDAPCSGEGMFRKDESMIGEWERHSVSRCSAMQRDIMKHAYRMLAPGGTLVYSTCTFSPEENEAQIAELLAAYQDLEVVPVALAHGWAPGRPDWIGSDLVATLPAGSELINSLSGTVRLWPHLTGGEGHYAAVLRKRMLGGVVEKDADNDVGKGSLERVGRGSKGERTEQAGRGEQRNGVRADAERGSKGERTEQAGRVERRSDMRVDAERGSKGERTEQTGRVERRNGVRVDAERGSKGERTEQAGRVERRGDMRADAERGSVMRAEAGRGRKARGDGLKRASGGGAAGVVDAVEAWRRFAAERLVGAERWSGEPVAYGSRVYLQPPGLPRLDGLRVVRAGWFVGEAGTHRFEPSQALAMGLRCGEAALTLRLRADEEATLRYLKGETLHVDASRLVLQDASESRTAPHDGDMRALAPDGTKEIAAKGYVLVCADDCPIGWGKYGGDGLLKNELPAGWRWM